MSELNAADGGQPDRRRILVDSLFVGADDMAEDLARVARSEARVFILYSTKQEAVQIFRSVMAR